MSVFSDYGNYSVSVCPCVRTCVCVWWDSCVEVFIISRETVTAVIGPLHSPLGAGRRTTGRTTEVSSTRVSTPPPTATRPPSRKPWGGVVSRLHSQRVPAPPLSSSFSPGCLACRRDPLRAEEGLRRCALYLNSEWFWHMSLFFGWVVFVSTDNNRKF